jgi:hypothetical protein
MELRQKIAGGAELRVPMRPQAFHLLVHLVRNRDRAVTKEELWDNLPKRSRNPKRSGNRGRASGRTEDEQVFEVNLVDQALADLRRAFGGPEASAAYIISPGTGTLRFIGSLVKDCKPDLSQQREVGSPELAAPPDTMSPKLDGVTAGPAIFERDPTPADSVSDESQPITTVRFAAVVIAFVFLCALAVTRTTDGPAWFLLATTILYAALYIVSVLLETSYRTSGHSGASVRLLLIFCLMLGTSLAALVLDIQFIRTGKPDGLWIALLLFLIAAVAQWLIVRTMLPSASIVPANFQSLTAQAAHLKNTSYFLSIVVFFWIPPVHCVFTLERELRMGRTHVVQRVLADSSLFSGVGVIYPKPAWLWVILLATVPAALKMGARLVDNLQSSVFLNRYLNLFYARALLYYTLSILCLLWYTQSIAQISAELPSLP